MLWKSWKKIVCLFLATACSFSTTAVAHADLAFLAFGDAVYDSGDIDLDYTDFETRLAELAVSAGITAFSAPEVAEIKAGIKSGLETAFAPFDDLTFSETATGGPSITFGETATPGALGVADGIDFLNIVPADTAKVFTANFAFIVNEFSGLTARAAQKSQLTAALAGTAIHEVAHNLGARHHDAYSESTFLGAPIMTGGTQNSTIMATGSTGLGEIGRETARTFSRNSLVKLAYAAGTLTTGNPPPIAEADEADLAPTGDAGSLPGTAQAITPDFIPLAGGIASKVILGDLDSIADVDVYSITAYAGGILTADINNDESPSPGVSGANTFLRIYAPDGSTVLASDNVSRYDGNDYGIDSFAAGTDGDGFDAAVYNVPIATTGTYFIEVSVDGTQGMANETPGSYKLLVHTTAIPEPPAFAFMGLAVVVVSAGRYVQRRRRLGATCKAS